MISQKLIDEARNFALEEARCFGAPAVFHVDYATKKAKELAIKLAADEKIVEVGTLLMDCQLGFAMKENRQNQHIEMSAKRAEEILNKFSELSKQEIENILACIREHHGVKNFYSKESEICCNADCYRFLSVEGIVGGLKTFGRPIEVNDLIKRWLEKVEEKWNVLTLDFCKKELESQYLAIKGFFTAYK